MYGVWKDCALKSGLSEPSEKHGLHLQAGNAAGNYVSKWGLEHEMTKGHVKRVSRKVELRLTSYAVMRKRKKKKKLIYLGSIISLLKGHAS